MKLRIPDPRPFADAVAWTAKMLPSRPSVPVLAGVRLTADDTGLRVAGFDYDASTEATVAAEVTEQGTTLVSGRLLAEITKALPNKPVEVAAAGSSLELVCGSARFTLPTMPVEDYPALPGLGAPVGTIPAGAFTAAVGQVAVAAGRDETLPTMTGVRIEMSKTGLALLATDRYRLAVRDIGWTPTNPNADAAVLVPARALADVAKTLGHADTVTLYMADGLFGVATPTRKATSRLLDGATYPPVRALIPQPDLIRSTATVDVVALLEVVRRVVTVAERTTPVLLTFNSGGLLVEAGGPEEARASEAMQAGFDGDELTIGFNPQYLIDGLTNLGAPTGVFRFVDATKPAVLCPAGEDDQPDETYRYLIMPIRVTR